MKKTHALLLILALVAAGAVSFPLIRQVASVFYQSQGGRLLRSAIDRLTTDEVDVLFCHPYPQLDSLAVRELELARQALDKAKVLDANGSHAYMLSGRVECMLGHPEKAVRDYMTYRDLRPQNPLGNLVLSFALEALGDERSAQEYWKIDPTLADNFLEAGEEARLAREYKEALSWYRRAISTRPGWNKPWYQTVLVYQEGDQTADALEAISAGIAQSSEYDGLSNLYYQLGWLKQYRREPPEITGAWEAYSQALLIGDYSLNDSQEAATYLNRGVLLAWQGRTDESISEYERSLELNPTLYWSYLGLARALWQKGDVEEARLFANQAIPLSPSPSDAYLVLGEFSEAEGDLIQARLLFEQALQFDPELESAKEALDRLPIGK